MKSKEKNKKEIPAPTAYTKGPVAKREDRLSSFLRLSLIGNVLLIFAIATIAAAAVLKPDRVVVSEKETGRIVGEYRTTAFRTNKELLAATQKFADNLLSYNSRTIRHDTASYMNMMSAELRERRWAYLERTNHVKNTELANTKSTLEIKARKLVTVKGVYAKCEISGNITIDQERGYSITKGVKLDKEDVKLKRSKIPFKLVADLKMVPVTAYNTAGVEVVDFYEYD